LFTRVVQQAGSALGFASVRIVERSRLESVKELEYLELLELPACCEAESVLASIDAAVLLPIRTAGRVTHVLMIDPGQSRRNLLSAEATFLRSLATQTGARLDALERERERINAEAGQERLMRQVTEAELRALRAQVNPHFLFNSLNTIAALIPTDPEGAETMTVRLAKVFRHVLASSERPLASLEEEMRFVQTYLSIEQARFGDRLRVRFDFDPRLAAEPVPSLLLQPVVENALKHGLAPKPGVVNLAIVARKHGDFLCLEVEDDGVGPGNAEEKASSNGLGLRNLISRLSNLYGERASLRLEPGAKSGSRVTILIPTPTPQPAT
jgi:two-component system LytT family sensor kinase